MPAAKRRAGAFGVQLHSRRWARGALAVGAVQALAGTFRVSGGAVSGSGGRPRPAFGLGETHGVAVPSAAKQTRVWCREANHTVGRARTAKGRGCSWYAKTGRRPKPPTCRQPVAVNRKLQGPVSCSGPLPLGLLPMPKHPRRGIGLLLPELPFSKPSQLGFRWSVLPPTGRVRRQAAVAPALLWVSDSELLLGRGAVRHRAWRMFG